MNEILLGQKCRPKGTGPATADARPEDYFYTVVAVWLEPSISYRTPTQTLTCALVGDESGGTNVLPFLELEFSDLDFG